MADGKITIEIVTPERKLVSAQVDQVTAPGLFGEFGVLPQHTPYLCQLDIGVLSYRMGSARYFVSVIGGYAEVGPDKVSILAERAERAEEIDLSRAEEARRRAQAHMDDRQSQGSIDFARAEHALKRAVARISVARQSGVA